MTQVGDMKKHLGIAALITAVLVLTGCTQQESEWKGEGGEKNVFGGSDLWTEQQTAKEWADIDRKISKGSTVAAPNGRDASCLQTLNVIGVGNPGTDYPVLTSTFEAVKKQVVQDVKGIDPALVTLVVPAYAGSDIPTPKHSQLSDGSLDTAKNNAADAVFAAVLAAQDKCAGSKTVLLGNGFGAAVIHEAEARFNPIASHSISGIILINDPNRSSGDATHTLSVGDSVISNLTGTANGKLRYDGLSGAKPFDAVLHDRILSVCAPTDAICNNDPQTPMGFSSYGQQIVWNVATSEKVYVTPSVSTLIAGWVAAQTVSALDTAAKSPDAYANLTGYLTYVNDGNGGARVIQDTPDPAVIATCEADYVIFATRGSGENIDGNENTKYRDTIDNSVGYMGGQPAHSGSPVLSGLTRFPATIAWEITSKLPADKKVRFVPVNYRAVPIPGISLPSLGDNTTTLLDYTASVKQGVEQLSRNITEFEQKCPDTPIVLVGYSQGAQVTHATLGKLPEASTEKIKSVLLIADPLMNSAIPHNGIQYDPTTDDGKGRFKKYPLALGISTGSGNIHLPPYVGPKIVQICDKDDPVCLTSGDNLARSMDVHSNAYSNPSHYVAPSNFAVEKLTGKSMLTDQQRSDIAAQ